MKSWNNTFKITFGVFKTEQGFSTEWGDEASVLQTKREVLVKCVSFTDALEQAKRILGDNLATSTTRKYVIKSIEYIGPILSC